MKDIRRKAEERAHRRAEEMRTGSNAPPGGGFQSERRSARDALRADINMLNGQNVHKIAADDETAQEARVLRVAAYCRVSTDDIVTRAQWNAAQRILNSHRFNHSGGMLFIMPEIT